MYSSISIAKNGTAALSLVHPSLPGAYFIDSQSKGLDLSYVLR